MKNTFLIVAFFCYSAIGAQILKPIKNINITSPSAPSNAIGFIAIDKFNTIFSADDGIHGSEIWITDGTDTGTKMLLDIDTRDGVGSFPHGFYLFKNKIFFVAFDSLNGQEIWATDGSQIGTKLVKDISLGSGSSAVGNFTEMDGRLFFQATEPINGNELWTTDGTLGGTRLIKDIAIGNISSNPSDMVVMYGRLYFSADDSINGRELWLSDGTTVGTNMIKNINPNSSSSPTNLFELKHIPNCLIFMADDGIHGRELWRSNGTSNSTYMIKDINPNSGSSSNGNSNFTLYYFNGYFVADDGIRGNELWVTDGSKASLFSEILTTPGLGSNPNNLSVMNGDLYFTADDGTNTMRTALYIYHYSLTKPKFLAAFDRKSIKYCKAFNNKLYFDVYDWMYSIDQGIYVTNGSPTGLNRITVLPLGSGGACKGISVCNNALYFNHYLDSTGNEPFVLYYPITVSARYDSVKCFGWNTGKAIGVASGGIGSLTYSWNTVPPTLIDSANNLVAGTYTLTAKDGNMDSAKVTVVVTQPAAALTVNVATTTNSATATPAGGTAPYTYSWSTTPDQTAATAIGLSEGDYTVTVSDKFLCTATKSATIYSSSSIQDVIGLETIQLYPIPATTTINIKGLMKEETILTANIIDMNGKIVSINKFGKVLQFNHKIDIETLPLGVYKLQLITPKGSNVYSIAIH